MKTVNLQPTARIAVNKNVLKNYSGKVFLKDKTEYSIELYNPTSATIGAEVIIDGESLGSILILRPGQRIYLERYFDRSNKFMFSTYEVENTQESKEIIKEAKNGIVEVKFYKEKKKMRFSKSLSRSPMPWDSSETGDFPYWKMLSRNVSNDFNGMFGAVSNEVSMDFCSTENSLNDATLNSTMETGRTELGSYSSQEFSSINIDLDSYPSWTEIVQILPESQRYLISDDIKVYCTECGTKKRNEVWKFCPSCGSKF